LFLRRTGSQTNVEGGQKKEGKSGKKRNAKVTDAEQGSQGKGLRKKEEGGHTETAQKKKSEGDQEKEAPELGDSGVCCWRVK